MMRYLVEPRDICKKPIVVKGYGFFSFAKQKYK